MPPEISLTVPSPSGVCTSEPTWWYQCVSSLIDSFFLRELVSSSSAASFNDFTLTFFISFFLSFKLAFFTSSISSFSSCFLTSSLLANISSSKACGFFSRALAALLRAFIYESLVSSSSLLNNLLTPRFKKYGFTRSTAGSVSILASTSLMIPLFLRIFTASSKDVVLVTQGRFESRRTSYKKRSRLISPALCLRYNCAVVILILIYCSFLNCLHATEDAN